MRTALKRSFKDKKYRVHFFLDGRKIKILCDDMDEIISCSSCWEDVVVGKSYTSRSIHNDAWIWFSVCDKCHKQELEEEKKRE